VAKVIPHVMSCSCSVSSGLLSLTLHTHINSTRIGVFVWLVSHHYNPSILKNAWHIVTIYSHSFEWVGFWKGDDSKIKLWLLAARRSATEWSRESQH
jgi:hypothetical protein